LEVIDLMIKKIYYLLYLFFLVKNAKKKKPTNFTLEFFEIFFKISKKRLKNPKKSQKNPKFGASEANIFLDQWSNVDFKKGAIVNVTSDNGWVVRSLDAVRDSEGFLREFC
jgi:hypothetical protein